MRYAKVKNGVIEWKGACPKSTHNVSGFDKFPDSEKKKHGYYPITETPVNIGENDPPVDTYTVRTDDVEHQYSVVSYALATLKAQKKQEVTNEGGWYIEGAVSVFDRYIALSGTVAQGKKFKDFVLAVKAEAEVYYAFIDAATTAAGLEFAVVFTSQYAKK